MLSATQLHATPPFPFDTRHRRGDQQLFGEPRPAFIYTEQEEIKDSSHDDGNDSGIDSEDVSTISPGSSCFSATLSPRSECSAPSPTSSTSFFPSCQEQQEPLSLVIDTKHSSSTPKHWKKSITRTFLRDENQENGPVSPVTSQTAEVLLSLAKPRTSVPVPSPSPSPRLVQPWLTTPSTELPSVSTSSTSRRILADPSNLPVSLPNSYQPQLTLPSSFQTYIPSVHSITIPLQEVPSNLKLTARPPFSIAELTKPSLTWHTPLSALATKPLVATVQVEEAALQCHECKKSFSTQSGFLKHQQLHSSNQIQKEFSCKYCSKHYTSQSALKMHIRTHTLPCKCPECGKSFSRPWLLQGHMRTHTGEKPFSCDHCSRNFADKSNLRAHLQTHLQNKKYCCPGCRKSFSRMSLLNKHTEAGCLGLQSRDEECVETLIGLSSGQLRT